jgi:hypothetical protein
MKEEMVNGRLSIIPANIKNPDLLNSKCSNSAKSETLFITPVKINLGEAGFRAKKTQNILVCDSPGIGDNRGAEVDIAAAYGII